MMAPVYSMPAAGEWLEQIDHTCAQVGIGHVDLLLDQANWIDAALPVLRVMRPVAPWFSLFEGKPEEHLLHQAPLLIRLDIAQPEHRGWLKECLRYYSINRLLIVLSALSFQDMCQASQVLSQARWGSGVGLLRYYDSRIFPVLMRSILTPAQRQLFESTAAYWSWVDRDEKPQWMEGGDGSRRMPAVIPDFLELTDQQIDQLACISSAQSLLDEDPTVVEGPDNESRFMTLYGWAVRAGEENYFGHFSDYARTQI